jgi:DNA polymerase-4
VRHLTDRVATRLRAKRRAGRTITVRVRFEDLKAITRSMTLPVAVAVTSIIAVIAEDLIRLALAAHPERKVITLLSVGVSHLEYEEALQLELPLDLGEDGLRPGTEKGSERWALDQAVDEVREKFGRASVGYASVILTGNHSVPDEFRELAER